MAGEAIPPGKQTFVDDTGRPLVGGLLYHYEPGTDTFRDTWQDEGETALNTNPIVLDARGQASIWGGGLYRQRLTDANGNAVWDRVTGTAPPPAPQTFAGQFVPTISEIPSLTIDSTVQFLNVCGYADERDGGGAVFARVGAQPVHPAKAQSADGAWWEYVPTGGVANCRVFGATSDAHTSAAANRQGIQDCIDFCIYFNNSYSPYVPGGVYTVNDWLHLGYGDRFHSTVLRGAGDPFVGNGAFGGTAIIFTKLDRPGLCVSGGRNVRVEDMALFGKNQAWIIAKDLAGYDTPPLVDDMVLANWFDTALVNPNAQYTPYAAIAIDPFAGARPANHYPDVVYPAWTGVVGQYNKAPSFETYLEHLNVIGWGYAVAIQPGNFNGNGDFVHLHHVTGSYCAGIVTAGNNQGRALDLDNCGFAVFHTAFLNKLHGQQQGQFDLNSRQSDYGKAIQLFDVSSNVGACKFSGGYCEALYRIGTFGSNGTDANPTLSIESMTFSLDSIQNDFRGYPVAWIDPGTPASVELSNCFVTSYKGFLPMGGIASGYALRNNRVYNRGESASLTHTYEQLAHDATAGGIVFMPVSVFVNRPREFYGMFTPVDIDSGAYGNAVPVGLVCRSKRAIPAVVWSRWAEGYSQEGEIQPIPQAWNTSGSLAAAFASVTLVDGVLTAVYNVLGDDLALRVGPSPGDILYHDASRLFFRVRSRAGTTVIAEITTGYNYVGGTFSHGVNTGGVRTPLVPFTVTGNFYVCNCRVFRPAFFLQADTAVGAALMTNAGNAQGSTFFFPTEVVAGDAVAEVVTVDNNISQASAKITLVDAGLHQITIDVGGATRTQARYPLPYLVRQPPPNV